MKGYLVRYSAGILCVYLKSPAMSQQVAILLARSENRHVQLGLSNENHRRRALSIDSAIVSICARVTVLVSSEITSLSSGIGTGAFP